MQRRENIFGRTLRVLMLPLESLLGDADVSEIMINGPARVYYEKHGRLHLSGLSFPDAARLWAVARNIGEYVGRPIDEKHPTAEARLPDGSRVQIVVPPCATDVHINIRFFRRASASLAGLVAAGGLGAEPAEFLGLMVEARLNIVLSGGTGTGKTTLLNALSAAIPHGERVVVIEDTRELQLAQPHAVSLEARAGGDDAVSVRDLVATALRMRPDRILVGEVRAGEALDMIQAMISGHAGSLTTVHADSARAAMARLELLCQMSDVAVTAAVARQQVAFAVQLVVQLVRHRDGSRRIAAVTEVVPDDAGQGYRLRDLYRLQVAGGPSPEPQVGLVRVAGRCAFADRVHEAGLGDRVGLTAGLLSDGPGPRPCNNSSPSA